MAKSDTKRGGSKRLAGERTSAERLPASTDADGNQTNAAADDAAPAADRVIHTIGTPAVPVATRPVTTTTDAATPRGERGEDQATAEPPRPIETAEQRAAREAHEQAMGKPSQQQREIERAREEQTQAQAAEEKKTAQAAAKAAKRAKRR